MKKSGLLMYSLYTISDKCNPTLHKMESLVFIDLKTCLQMHVVTALLSSGKGVEY